MTSPDAVAPAEWKRWRKAERERLIAARLEIPPEVRRGFAARMADALSEHLGSPEGRIVSTYWPFRGEPDLRAWMKDIEARGGHCALPVVIGAGHPLVFRLWRHGEPLARGVWNIPIPSAEASEVSPDVVIAPLVGHDRARYRLGYGGGFFDRTLAALPRRPLVIGVGYGQSAMETIHPQPHDIAMDVIVTEHGIAGS